jgi:hypothetical protein
LEAFEDLKELPDTLLPFLEPRSSVDYDDQIGFPYMAETNIPLWHKHDANPKDQSWKQLNTDRNQPSCV